MMDGDIRDSILCPAIKPSLICVINATEYNPRVFLIAFLYCRYQSDVEHTSSRSSSPLSCIIYIHGQALHPSPLRYSTAIFLLHFAIP